MKEVIILLLTLLCLLFMYIYNNKKDSIQCVLTNKDTTVNIINPSCKYVYGSSEKETQDINFIIDLVRNLKNIYPKLPNIVHDLGLTSSPSNVNCIIYDTNTKPISIYNELYAKVKGYNYQFIKSTSIETLPITDEKYKYIVYIGDTILIYNFDINIEDIGESKFENFIIYENKTYKNFNKQNNKEGIISVEKLLDKKYIGFTNDKEFYTRGFIWPIYTLQNTYLTDALINFHTIMNDYYPDNYTYTKDKIAVVSCYTDNIHEYAYYSETINRKYCKLHGYDFFMDKMKEPDGTLFGSWYKLDVIEKYINMGYRYVFWIDADAFFYDKNKKIEHYIQYLNKEIFMVASSDKLTGSDIINTGVMIFYNCSWTKLFIKAWKQFINTPFRKNFKCHEQTVFSLLYKNNIVNKHVKVLEEQELNSLIPWTENFKYNMFILHLMITSKDMRILVMYTVG